MNKTTVYLPEDLELRLDAESRASGVSKAELIRTAIRQLLEASGPPKKRPLPVFRSGRVRDSDSMDADIYAHIKERAARR